MNLKELEGHNFEDITSEKLEEKNIVVDYKNYRDNPKNPSFEIDILAHYKSRIFVIECKSWLLSSGYIFGDNKKMRDKQLRQEIQKQKKRVKYVEENLKTLGYNNKKYQNIISIIITALYESYKYEDNSHIIPFDKIEDIKNLDP